MSKRMFLPALLCFAWNCAKPAQSAPAPAQAPAGATKQMPGPGAVSTPNADPFPSTYKAFPSRTTLIRNVTVDRKSTRLNSSHIQKSRMPSSA